MTAPGQSGRDWRPTAAAALFSAGTLLLVYGFWSSRVVEDGLLSAWQPKGVRQFAVFLTTALALALSAARPGRTRLPLVLLASAWLTAAHGVGAVASVALIATAALGLGSRVARGAFFAEGDGLEAALLRAAAGVAAIVAAVQLLAHFPVNSPALHLLLLGGAAWLGREALREDASQVVAFCRAPAGPRAPLYASAVLLVVLAVHSAVAAVPEAASDALAVHLMVPQQVAARGEWGFDFHAYLWALVPMGADWLYTTANLLGGEAAARLANFALLVAVVLLVREQARRSLAGPLASLLVAGCAAAPIVFQESFSLWVENLVTLFLLSAALIVTRSWTRPRGPDVAAFALCAGGAMMTKSLGLFGLPLVAAMTWSIAASAVPTRLRLRRAVAGFALLALVGAGPYLYAFAVTGNPLFPFFNDVFESPYFGGRFVDTRWIDHGGADLLYRMTFRSSLYGELYDGAFGFHHLLLLPLGLVAALARWPGAGRLVLAATLAEVALFLAGTQYIRYLYPFLWGAAVLEAEALRWLIELPWLRRPALAIVGSAFLLNLAFLPTGYYLLRDFPVDTVFSREARERFVLDEIPYRKLNETVNAVAGRYARVLYLTEPGGAFLEGTPVYANWHNPALAARIDAETPDAVVRILADERITHVIIASDPELPVFRRWLAGHGRKLLSLGGSDLYAIDAQAADTH